MKTGEIIERLLKLQNKTQKDLALFLVDNDESKCRPATVNDWIKKGKLPKGKNLQKISEFFNVPIDVILGEMGTGDPADTKYQEHLGILVSELEEGIKFLSGMGYLITFDNMEVTISWDDEERTISHPQFDLLFKKIYKLFQVIQLEIEDIY